MQISNNYALVLLNNKPYNNKVDKFDIYAFSYHPCKNRIVDYEVLAKKHTVNSEDFYKLYRCGVIIPINFKVDILNLEIIKTNIDNQKDAIINTAKAVREFMVKSYGVGTDLAGHCIEASDYIVKIMRTIGYKNWKQVEGYCLYDNEDYGSDHPYDEHTWVQSSDNKIYVDVTADQFNAGMFEENDFKDIIISNIKNGLPHGMRYDKPKEGIDYWTDYTVDDYDTEDEDNEYE